MIPSFATFANYIAALTANGIIGAAPTDPGTSIYSSISSGTSNQQYCFYVPLEGGNFAVANQMGAGKKNLVPTGAAACTPDM